MLRSKFKKIMAFAELLLVFLLCVASIISFNSLGWFSNNKEVATARLAA